jgi:hypothetical protein
MYDCVCQQEPRQLTFNKMLKHNITTERKWIVFRNIQGEILVILVSRICIICLPIPYYPGCFNAVYMFAVGNLLHFSSLCFLSVFLFLPAFWVHVFSDILYQISSLSLLEHVIIRLSRVFITSRKNVVLLNFLSLTFHFTFNRKRMIRYFSEIAEVYIEFQI